MRVLVCGGRRYTDAATIRRELLRCGATEVIHGNAKGTDLTAATVAREMGLPVRSYTAEWETFGRAAGPIRNRRMLEQAPDLVLAFPGGRGTSDMIGKAKRAGVPVCTVDAA